MCEVPSFNNGGRMGEGRARGGMRPQGAGGGVVFMYFAHTVHQKPNIHYNDLYYPSHHIYTVMTHTPCTTSLLTPPPTNCILAPDLYINPTYRRTR